MDINRAYSNGAWRNSNFAFKKCKRVNSQIDGWVNCYFDAPERRYNKELNDERSIYWILHLHFNEKGERVPEKDSMTGGIGDYSSEDYGYVKFLAKDNKRISDLCTKYTPEARKEYKKIWGAHPDYDYSYRDQHYSAGYGYDSGYSDQYYSGFFIYLYLFFVMLHIYKYK